MPKFLKIYEKGVLNLVCLSLILIVSIDLSTTEELASINSANELRGSNFSGQNLFPNPDNFNCSQFKGKKVQINLNRPCEFYCSYNPSSDYPGPIRLNVHLLSSSSAGIVFVSAQQMYVISSWTIPIIFVEHGYKQPFTSISEILCPPKQLKSETVYFRLETSRESNISINVTLTTTPITLDLNTSVRVYSTPVSPWLKKYTWGEEDSVLVTAKSIGKHGKNVCAFLSVQNAQCPINMDRKSIVSGIGQYQSFEKQGGMVARKSDFPDGIYVVILPLPDDAPCNGMEVGDNKTARGKTVELTILPHKTIGENWFVFLLVGGFICAFLTGSTVLVLFSIKRNFRPENFTSSEDEEGLLSSEGGVSRGPSVITRQVNAGIFFGEGDRSMQGTAATNFTDNRRQQERVDGSGELAGESRGLPESRQLSGLGVRERLLAIVEGGSAGMENRRGDIAITDGRSNLDLGHIDSGSRAPPKEITTITRDVNPRFVYWWKVYTEYQNERPETRISEVGFHRNILIVAVFMALPLADILRSYMHVFSFKGNEDQCYFNNMCITTFGIFKDFSRVFTNIGYICGGVAFYIISKWHRNLGWKVTAAETLGVSKNYSLFESLALGLVIQGIMSAMYHVCPNEVTLRFDMMFMYVEAVVLIVGIWGLRHGGVAHHVYPSVALIGGTLLAAEVREWIPDGVYWTFVVAIHLFFTSTIGVMLCKFDTWSFSPFAMVDIWKNWKPIVQNVSEVLREEPASGLGKTWTVIRVIVGLVSNLALMILGPIVDMEVYLYILIVCVMNMILYIVNYISTKTIKHRETGTSTSWICLTLSLVFWIVAMIFFSIHSTDTETTAAMSRNLNSSCLLFGVLDAHDIWHLSSAMALFFSFVGILTMDDDLSRRNPLKIPVF